MIHPTAFNTSVSPVTVALSCTICGWSGEVALSAIAFGQTIAGTPDPRFIVLPCGNAACGSVSTHPVGGGASPRAIQALFILKHMQAQGLTFSQAHTLVQAHVTAMDGPERFKYAAATAVTDLEAA